MKKTALAEAINKTAMFPKLKALILSKVPAHRNDAGWLETRHVLNTRPLAQVLSWLAARRRS